ncbi:MAG TPA: phosphatidate cytidylyltransferase, partial [Beijerinckiaceae bacterium]|nr:phosphatidate cytidylyltransferase [Beijerinckiaceae bacterium]
MTHPRVFAPHGEGDANPSNPTAVAPSVRRSPWADLTPRVASALVMIVFAVATLIMGGRLFAIFWFAASLAVHWEWQRMVGGRRQLLRFFIGAVALAAAASLTLAAALDLAGAVLVIAAVALAWAAGPHSRLWAAAGIFYAAALVVSVCLLRCSVFDGFEAVLWLFAVVWGTDV